MLFNSEKEEDEKHSLSSSMAFSASLILNFLLYGLLCFPLSGSSPP